MRKITARSEENESYRRRGYSTDLVSNVVFLLLVRIHVYILSFVLETSHMSFLPSRSKRWALRGSFSRENLTKKRKDWTSYEGINQIDQRQKRSSAQPVCAPVEINLLRRFEAARMPSYSAGLKLAGQLTWHASSLVSRSRAASMETTF